MFLHVFCFPWQSCISGLFFSRITIKKTHLTLPKLSTETIVGDEKGPVMKNISRATLTRLFFLFVKTSVLYLASNVSVRISSFPLVVKCVSSVTLPLSSGPVQTSYLKASSIKNMFLPERKFIIHSQSNAFTTVIT